MTNPRKIVFCAAEVSPFAKVGGLGDVIGSLPKALSQLGEEPIVCVPLYGCTSTADWPLVDTGMAFTVAHEGQNYPIRVLEHPLPQSSIPVYFMANQTLYGQTEAIYPVGQPEYEALRFEVLGKATFQLLKQLQWQPDILHLHDWHTANMAVFLKQQYWQDPFFKHTATVLTIHNMAYQGITPGRNRLKEGLLASDALVAVSPTYAMEIMTPVCGAGLEAVVKSQRHKLYGILNGIDTALFNPETDAFIPQRYGRKTVQDGKRACKEALQLHVGLPILPDVPVFGMVTRLVSQKGIDLLLKLLHALEQQAAQFVFLGTGQPDYEDALRQANATTLNIRSMVDFNLPLGQLIYAGADAFLMPSQFEPCGLSQLIALRYGTLPVVRKTGGLADTVIDLEADPEAGNGFVFTPYTPEALLEAMRRAMHVWHNNPALWWGRVHYGMTQDFSWRQSALQYQQVYQAVCRKALQRSDA